MAYFEQTEKLLPLAVALHDVCLSLSAKELMMLSNELQEMTERNCGWQHYLVKKMVSGILPTCYTVAFARQENLSK